MTGQIFSQGFQISDYDFIGRYSNEWDKCDVRIKKNQQDQMSLLIEIYPYKEQIDNCAYLIISPEYVDTFISNVANAFKKYEKLLAIEHHSPMRNYSEQLKLIPCKANLIYKPHEVDFAYKKNVDLLFSLKIKEPHNLYLYIEVDDSFYEKTKLIWLSNYIGIRLDVKALPKFAAILDKDRIDKYRRKN